VTGAIAAAFGRYDVVHFHAEGPCAMLWLPKLFGKRCIATIHGLDHQRAKWGKFAKTYIMLGEKCAAKFADEIIVLSKGVQQYFQDTYGRETVFIPNGVTKPEIREAQLITEQYGLEKDDYILFLGRLVPEKGVAYLIDAFKNVRTDKKLVIAGGSSDTAAFAQELKDRAAGDARILFTGFVQGRMLEELYSNAYVYVLPSDLEGMPLSLLEAMSYGNCCVTSDIEECASVTEDHGLTFPKGNVECLRDLLQRLCDDAEEVRNYRETSAGYIAQKYSWDDVVNQTLELYQ
jgi:glycosyltransferase involved in cell wall biosynthesis